ncbi:glycosyltransferase 87 family protein [Kallotenue papyrolyticum]|uniref:glycosyltransferase 87 family protein n=1 Tax=Kallotenue papyrolyticum TaxID=1325125 RepID=UPI000478661C|nr:glycosyltransferase 87 family protein [Kallotenue papyrolyticum]
MDRSHESGRARRRAAQPAIEPLATARGAGPLLTAAAALLLGVLLRLPTANFSGPPTQSDFNRYIFQHLGAYSDITSLWFRDQLWNHPVPYLDYALEYPVGLGLLIWLISAGSVDVMGYFLLTAVVLIGCGLLTVALVARFPAANPWLLALAPALPLYGVLNWDLASILLMVAALLALRQRREGWGALLLALAIWTKFFPIVLAPLVLLERVLQRRWRDALRFGAVIVGVSLALNLPVALQRSAAGWQVRESWLHFFRFNQQRPREVNLWNLFDRWGLTLEQINLFSALLLVGGLGGLALLLVWQHARDRAWHQEVLLPAALAAIAWFFFINKVYSPQYSLWLITLLALLAAPPLLVALFGAVDIMYFAASFVLLYLSETGNPASGWFYGAAMLPAMVLRETLILVMILYALWRIVQPTLPASRVNYG